MAAAFVKAPQRINRLSANHAPPLIGRDFRRRSFPNRIDPIAILNNSVGRDQRTAEVPGRRDDGSVRRVTDRNKRYRFE